MSASEIPYQLRPNKFIDRQIFIDLLQRLLPYVGIEKYVYVSMGGKHLIDHKAIYRHVGVTALFSFDQDHHTYNRQEFNKPIDSAICEEFTSGDLPAKIDEILASFPEVENLIVWLDYTDPNSRLTQLQEFIETLKRLQSGDIIKLTMNANPQTLCKSSNEWKVEEFENPQQYRAHKLREQLGSYMPSGLNSILDSELPAALAECIKIAVSKAEEYLSNIVFFPVISATYRDGQQMLTVTCIAIKESTIGDQLLEAIGRWDFASNDWTDVKRLEAPDLSLREKMQIDEHLSKNSEQILEEIHFPPSNNDNKSIKALNSYKMLHRYYPTFHHIEP